MVLLSHCRERVLLALRPAALVLLVAIAAGAAPSLVSSGRAAATGLVAAYNFDAGSGTTLADLSGNGNNGTISGATWSSAGKYGGALSFDGSSDLVKIPDSPSLDLTNGMTLEAWVNPSAEGGRWRTALIKEQPGELVYGLYGSTDSGPPSGHVFVNGVDTMLRGNTTPPLNAWTHVAATYDGTVLKVYVNGLQQTSMIVGGTIASSGGTLDIGGNNVWSEWFAGLIDDVRVYNRALSASEIQTDMATPIAGGAPPPPPPPTTSGLVASYSFNAGSGTTLADVSGNGHNGTISGATWSSAGKYGGALSFNGTNSMVTIPDAPGLDLTNGMTLEAWVNPSAEGGRWRTALIKEQPGELVYGLYGSTDSGPPSGHVFVNGVDTMLRGNTTPPLNAWTHVAATYDGTVLKVYVNGLQQTSMIVGGTIASSGGTLDIGGNNVWSEWFAGLIDDVRVYNRALSASEIQTDMATPVGGSSPPPSADTQAPTAPTGLTVTGVSASSVSLSWNASTDNVGVAGYGVYENGALALSTSSTSTTLAGLACGTSFTFAVDAFDAAGNRSAKSGSVSATTSACPPVGSASIFLSPTGSDSNPCTQSAPCRSWNRAYTAASPGSVVQIGGGTYPGQTIDVDTSMVGASADVVFVPASGANVTINGDLEVSGSHIDIRGSVPYNIHLHNLLVTAIAGSNTAQFDTFENLDGAGFEIGPNHHITIKGGDWGPNYTCGGGGTVEDKVGPDGLIMNQWPHDIVLDGLYIHDQNSEDLNSCHMGGLFLISGGPITLRNTVFSQDVVYDIQIQDFTSPSCCGMTFGPVHDLTMENNWFGPPVTGLADPGRDTTNDNQQEIQFDPRSSACWKNILVRYNSFFNGPAPAFDGGTCYQNVRYVGNIIGSQGQCVNASGLTWSFNAWLGGGCGSTDIGISSLPYANKTIGSEDYHLTGGPAQDLISLTTGDYALATDIDGDARPIGPARDAGADER